jgi:hypothetical protein
MKVGETGKREVKDEGTQEMTTRWISMHFTTDMNECT